MGIYIRASRNVGVGLPFWLAAFVIPIYWSMLACLYICIWSFQFAIWITVVTFRMIQQGVAAAEVRRRT